jgi:uncharacterized membrane protein
MITLLLINTVLIIIGIILVPIDAVITTFIPNIATYTQNIIDFFGIITTYIGWGLSALGLNAVIITLLVAFWTFKLTAPAIAWVFKLIFKWWHAVKG